MDAATSLKNLCKGLRADRQVRRPKTHSEAVAEHNASLDRLAETGRTIREMERR